MSISQEQLSEIASIPNKEIDTKDIPELDADFWENATLRFKGKPVNELTSQEKEEFIEYRDRIIAQSLGPDRETVPVDEDITAWFKTQGTDYHARINSGVKRLCRGTSLTPDDPFSPSVSGRKGCFCERWQGWAAQEKGLEGDDAWLEAFRRGVATEAA